MVAGIKEWAMTGRPQGNVVYERREVKVWKWDGGMLTRAGVGVSFFLLNKPLLPLA